MDLILRIGMEENPNYRVDRPIYSYEDLTKTFDEEKKGFNILRSLKSKVNCPKKPSVKKVMERICPFPFIIASFYTFRLLLSDLIAGFTMLVFHIPQGMAYSLLAGLQPINGLYASFIPPLIYLLLGTSRHLSMGTFSIIAILSSTPAVREATLMMASMPNQTINETTDLVITDRESFEMAKLQVSVATTLLAGLFQVIMGLCQFGMIMNYVSDAMIGGFTTAASFHVLFSQFGDVLGYSVQRYTGIFELPYKLFLFAMKAKEIHWITIGISIGCIAVLFLFSEVINPWVQKKIKCPIPIQFILVIIATVASYYGNIAANYNVKIVGPIPSGLPKVMVPDVTILPRIVLDAFILAIVAFIMNSALVKIYALEFNYEVNFNQEFVAYGVTNVFSSFFQCMMSAGSLARSAVVVEVGMKSQIASIISCFFMLFVLLFISPLFQYVPDCVLSAIILVSLKGMIMQLRTLPALYKLSKYDFNVWIVTFLATIFLDVPFGLISGFMFSLLTIVIRLQMPKTQVLGQLPNTNIYKDMKTFAGAKEIPFVKIFRFEAPLCFANAEQFKTKLCKKTNVKFSKPKSQPAVDETASTADMTMMSLETIYSPASSDPTTSQIFPVGNQDSALIKMDNETKFVIIDFSSINYVDNVGIRVLNNIYSGFQKLGITIMIAAPNNNTREMLEKSQFAKEQLNRIMFVTVHDAVLKCTTRRDIVNKD